MNITSRLAALIDPNEVHIFNISAADVLKNGIDIAYFAAAVTAVIAIIIGAFYFVTSSSDSASLTKARNTIVYAVIGLVAVSAAFLVTKFILGAFK